MTQEIKNEKFEGLLVKVPDEVKDISIHLDCILSYWSTTNDEAVASPLPEGEWRLIGNPFELADIDCVDIVGPDNPGQVFNSLLSSLEVYESKPECANTWCNNGKIDCGYNEFLNCFICEEAEERTGNWVLIQKIW